MVEATPRLDEQGVVVLNISALPGGCPWPSWMYIVSTRFLLLLVRHLLLEAMHLFLVYCFYYQTLFLVVRPLLLVAMPFATSSVLAPICWEPL